MSGLAGIAKNDQYQVWPPGHVLGDLPESHLGFWTHGIDTGSPPECHPCVAPSNVLVAVPENAHYNVIQGKEITISIVRK